MKALLRASTFALPLMTMAAAAQSPDVVDSGLARFPLVSTGDNLREWTFWRR